MYCHSLTDPSILGPLASAGMHTLTYFGVHTPARLFEGDVEEQRDIAVGRALDAINEHLAEPIESLVALDRHGEPCLEAKAPQDVEEALAMPGGHIFHGDLAWPWAPNRARTGHPRAALGRATDLDNVLLCGSGARRGGAVSGLGGHNAAQAVLRHAPPADRAPVRGWSSRPAPPGGSPASDAGDPPVNAQTVEGSTCTIGRSWVASTRPPARR